MSQYDAAFAASEGAHGLQAGLLQAVAIQESRLNQWAIRYESEFYDHYIKPALKPELGGIWPMGVSEETERFARSTSWGLLQVMGQVARELGFVGQFLSQLCIPEVGLEFGARALAAKLKRYGNLPDALSAYNAGRPTDGNRTSYVAPILSRLSGTP